MALNMNPQSSLLSQKKTGPLVLAPSQIASVTDVEKQEEPQVAPLASSVPEVTQQPAQEPLDNPVAEEPAVPVDASPRVTGVPLGESPITETTEEDIKKIDEALGLHHEVLDTDNLNYSDFEIDYDHPTMQQDQADRTNKHIAENTKAYTEAASTLRDPEQIDKLVKARTARVFAEAKAKEIYTSWDNRAKRFGLSTLEFPRYVVAADEAVNRLINGNTTSNDPKQDLRGEQRTLLAILESHYEELKNEDTRAARMAKGFGLMQAIKERYAEPVFNGTDYSQEFQNDLLSDIKKETGVQLSQEFIETEETKEAVGGGLLMGPLSMFRGVVAKGARKVTGLSVRSAVEDLSKKQVLALGVLDSTKGAAAGFASVEAPRTAIDLIDPKSREAELLINLGVGGAAAGAAAKTTEVAHKYTPTAIALRGTAFTLNKAATGYRTWRREKAIDKKMAQGLSPSEATKAYYDELPEGHPERNDLALRLLNDTTLTHDERLNLANQVLDKAFEDPNGREAEVVRLAIEVNKRDKDAVEGAWSQAELLNKAFDSQGFRSDVFDVYDGRFKQEFLNLRKTLASDDIIAKQAEGLKSIRRELEGKHLTAEERSELVLAASAMEKTIGEMISDRLTAMQQNVVGALDFHTNTELWGVENMDAANTKLRESLTKAHTEAKSLLKHGYASIDPEGKVRSDTGLKEINDMLGVLTKGDKVSVELNKAFSSLVGDAAARHQAEGTGTKLLSGSKKDPMERFSGSAKNNTDAVVYVNADQFTTLTGVTLNEDKSVKNISSVTSVQLTKDKNGDLGIMKVYGAEHSAALGKDTLIPISLNSKLLENLEGDGVIRIKAPDGSVVAIDVGKQMKAKGSERHNVALTDHLIFQQRSRGNLSLETPQTSFSPEFNIDNFQLTYKDMDQFQRRIRKLRREAFDREDWEGYDRLKVVDESLSDMIQKNLSKVDTALYDRRKALDGLYGDSFIPAYSSETSIVGKGIAIDKQGVSKFFMSKLAKEIPNVPELIKQVQDLVNPETSPFIKSIDSKEARLNLRKLMGLNKETLKAMEQTGHNVASSLMTIKLQDLVAKMYQVIGSKDDPIEHLRSNIQALTNSPDFQVLQTGIKGTPTEKHLNAILNLENDEDLGLVLHDLKMDLDSFNSMFYKSVKGLKDPSNTKATLDIVANLHKTEKIVADLTVKGELDKAAPILIRTVLTEVLKTTDQGVSISTIDHGLQLYSEGLQQLPGGHEAILLMKGLKKQQEAIERLRQDAGKASILTQAETDKNLMGRLIGMIPRVGSNIALVQKKIISMQYAVLHSVSAIIQGEIKAAKKIEGKAGHEIIVAAFSDKAFYDRLMSLDLAVPPAEQAKKLRGLSWYYYSMTGADLPAVDALASLAEMDREDALEYLKGTPEYAEAEKEAMMNEITPERPYGSRADGTPKEQGYFGELKSPTGEVMTEYSIGVNIDGKEVEIPTLVPTLTEKQKESLVNTGKITPAIEKKAVDHAMKRLQEGKSPFWNEKDDTVKDIPETLQRPEEQMDVSQESMDTAAANDPMHEVNNLEGPIVDGMTADEATKTKATFKFHELRSSGISKEQVLKILEASGMGDNNNKSLILSALDEAYGPGK